LGHQKKADITSIKINTGQTATVNYTVNVQSTYHEVRKTVSGAIRVNNTGTAAANVTYVRDRIEYKIGAGPWTEITTIDISGPVGIPAGSFLNFPYSIVVTAVEGATNYRNIAIVGVSNAILSGAALVSMNIGIQQISQIAGYSDLRCFCRCNRFFSRLPW